MADAPATVTELMRELAAAQALTRQLAAVLDAAVNRLSPGVEQAVQAPFKSPLIGARPGGWRVAVPGASGAASLATARDRIPRRIPLAKPWIARVLVARGLSTAEIARTLLTSDVSVRKRLQIR